MAHDVKLLVCPGIYCNVFSMIIKTRLGTDYTAIPPESLSPSADRL